VKLKVTIKLQKENGQSVQASSFIDSDKGALANIREVARVFHAVWKLFETEGN
jgi:hypothetical protein